MCNLRVGMFHFNRKMFHPPPINYKKILIVKNSVEDVLFFRTILRIFVDAKIKILHFHNT